MVLKESTEKCDVHSYHYYGKVNGKDVSACCEVISLSGGTAPCT
jgi:hypothetical protein